MKLSWRYKLIIFAVLIALLPLGISSYNMIGIASDELISSTNSELSNASDKFRRSINTLYDEQWTSTLELVKSGVENEELGAPEKAALISAAVENIPDLLYLNLVFEISPGEFVSAVSVAKESISKKAAAEKISIDSLFGISNSYIAGFKNNKPLNDLYISSEPEIFKSNNIPLITIGLKVTIPGAPPAFFIAKFSAEKINEMILSDKLSERGKLYILSKSGKLIFSAPGTVPPKNLVNDATLLLKNDKKIEIVNKYLDENGDKIVASPSFPDKLEWIIIAQKNESDAYAIVRSMMNTLLFWVFLGLIFAFTAVFVFSSTISKPIVNISKTAVTIAKGNFDVDVEYKIDDEIGRLGKSLVDMSSSLKESFAKIAKQNKELEEYSRTLEIKVDERTKELKEKNTELEETLIKLKETQDQLIVQQKLASLGALTAGIAHEIKNPLNFVNNFAKLTGSLVEELDEEISRGKEKGDIDCGYLSEIFEDIRTNSKKIAEHGSRADNIVKSMLEHSRTEKGELQKFDLNGLITETMGLAYHGMRNQIESFNTKLEKKFQSESLQIMGIPQALNQVFINIFNNAFYAMHKKREQAGESFSPCLTTSTTDLGERVEIRIRDNGTGIPKDVVDKIFEPFFTTKPTGEGTGLGLSLTYDIIVQMHKGELKVETEPGQFSEFLITLPKQQ